MFAPQGLPKYTASQTLEDMMTQSFDEEEKKDPGDEIKEKQGSEKKKSRIVNVTREGRGMIITGMSMPPKEKKTEKE